MKVTLKALRANFNLNQREMARIVGISKRTWQNYEQGRTVPSTAVLRNIEKKFNVSYDELIFCSKKRFNRNKDPVMDKPIAS